MFIWTNSFNGGGNWLSITLICIHHVQIFLARSHPVDYLFRFLMSFRAFLFLSAAPSTSPGCGWGIITFLHLSRLALTFLSTTLSAKASVHRPPSGFLHIGSTQSSIAAHLSPVLEQRVTDDEQESGICGILCNELVRKECGPDGEQKMDR